MFAAHSGVRGTFDLVVGCFLRFMEVFHVLWILLPKVVGRMPFFPERV